MVSKTKKIGGIVGTSIEKEPVGGEIGCQESCSSLDFPPLSLWRGRHPRRISDRPRYDLPEMPDGRPRLLRRLFLHLKFPRLQCPLPVELGVRSRAER